MTEQRASLEKSFSKVDVFALAFGAMIGWGWVMLAGYWVQTAGWLGAILAFLIGAFMCVFVGLCYAELTPMFPVAGGGLVFAYRGMGYGWAWVAAWATAFAYLGVAAWEGIAVATAIDYLVPIPQFGYIWNIAGYDVYFSWALVGMIVGLLVLYMNYRGASAAAWFQNLATIVLALVGVVLVLGGAIKGDPANMGALFTPGAKGFIAVLIMAPAMYVGFDVIPQSAEEMNVPLKTIPKVLFLAIAMAALWYVIMCFAVAIAAPMEITANGKVPVADAMAYLFNGAMWGKVVIVGGLAGIITSWNGFIVGGARVMFAMGRAKMLPPVFGTVNKHGVPVAALCLMGFFVLISPLLGKNALVWFVDASSLGVVVVYLLVCISFLGLRKREPNFNRPWKVPNGNVIGWLGVIISVIFALLYFPWSPGALIWPYEWVMLIIWAAIGVILAIWNKKTYPDVTLKERELLIFGEDLARKEVIGKE
jgi:APA family basic amino acid/polyamine antiporter